MSEEIATSPTPSYDTQSTAPSSIDYPYTLSEHQSSLSPRDRDRKSEHKFAGRYNSAGSIVDEGGDLGFAAGIQISDADLERFLRERKNSIAGKEALEIAKAIQVEHLEEQKISLGDEQRSRERKMMNVMEGTVRPGQGQGGHRQNLSGSSMGGGPGGAGSGQQNFQYNMAQQQQAGNPAYAQYQQFQQQQQQGIPSSAGSATSGFGASAFGLIPAAGNASVNSAGMGGMMSAAGELSDIDQDIAQLLGDDDILMNYIDESAMASPAPSSNFSDSNPNSSSNNNSFSGPSAGVPGKYGQYPIDFNMITEGMNALSSPSFADSKPFPAGNVGANYPSAGRMTMGRQMAFNQSSNLQNPMGGGGMQMGNNGGRGGQGQGMAVPQQQQQQQGQQGQGQMLSTSMPAMPMQMPMNIPGYNPNNMQINTNFANYPSHNQNHRSPSQGASTSSSVSPVLDRRGYVGSQPGSAASMGGFGPASVPNSSGMMGMGGMAMGPGGPGNFGYGSGSGMPIGQGGEPVEKARSVPGSLKKARKTTGKAPRTSLASNPSGDDTPSRIANRSATQAKLGMSPATGPSAARLGISSGRTSLMPTPAGSNEEEEENSTKDWKVVSPPAASLAGLPVLIHGIKRKGAKSRVETQIKMKISIVRPTPGFRGLPDGFTPPSSTIGRPNHGRNGQGSSSDTSPERSDYPAGAFEKVGTFKALKIKAGMGAKRRSKKNAEKEDADSLGPYQPEDVLFLDTEVWCTDAPHRAYACVKCVNRERKRAQSRSTSSKKKSAQQSDSDDLKPGNGTDSNKMQTDEPVGPVDADGLTQEDKDRILLFNCGPIVDLNDGECDLPARLTCYCRHHKEKSGFRVVMNLRNHQGRIVATGTTPTIMITDDHKTTNTSKAHSVASAFTDGNVSGASKSVASSARPRARQKKVRENSASTEDEKKSTTVNKARKGKPYERKPPSDTKSTVSNNHGAMSPRGTFTPHGLSMTPLHGRSVPGSPMPLTGRTSYFQGNGFPEPGSGAVSPSLVMSGGPFDGQQSRATSPANLTAALPAISQQLSAWAASGAQMRSNNGLDIELDANINAMQLDERPWTASPPDASPIPAAPGNMMQSFGQASSQNAMQFQAQPPQPHFGQMALPPQLEMGSGLQFMPNSNFDNGPSPTSRQFDVEPDFDSMLNYSPHIPAPVPPAPQAAASPSSDFVQSDPSSLNDWSSGAIMQQMMEPTVPAPQAERASPQIISAITRLVPAEGPTHGGVEVTVLGENFHPGMTCLFGNFPAVTVQSYGPTTLVCLLPPSPTPGAVQVRVMNSQGQAFPPPPGQPPVLFTYNEISDRKLMEMALTAVGLRVTGQVVGAVEIARRIMSGPNQGEGGQGQGQNGQNGMQQGGDNGQQRALNISVEEQHLADELATAIYSNSGKSVEQAVIRFLSSFLPHEARSRGPHKRRRTGQTALNHLSAEGQTLLHLASLLGYADLVHLLIRADAPIDIHDRNGYTAFIFAAMAGHASIARMLLAAGAREASCTFSNQTASTLAQRAGHGAAYASISARARKMAEQVVGHGDRRASSSSQSSLDADNPSSATDIESIEADTWAISPNRLTTPADILAVRSPQLLPKSKYDSRTDHSATPKASDQILPSDQTTQAACSPRPQTPSTVTADEPPPYAAVDTANWLQRTLSHLPGTQGIPPTPQIKDFFPPALWEKLPSAQIFVPHVLPQSLQQAREGVAAGGEWTAQAWLAMPVSAFMNAFPHSRTAVVTEPGVKEDKENVPLQSGEVAQQQQQERDVAKKQAELVARGVAHVTPSGSSTATPAPATTTTNRRKESLKDATATSRQSSSSSTAVRRSRDGLLAPQPMTAIAVRGGRSEVERGVGRRVSPGVNGGNGEMVRPAPVKVDKMLFLFWLPVLAMAFIYTIATTLPVTLGKALLGPLLEPLTRFLRI